MFGVLRSGMGGRGRLVRVLAALGLAVLDLAGCAAPRSGQVVQVPAYAPGSTESPLSRVPRAIVVVRPFGELGSAAPGEGGNPRFGDAGMVETFAVAPSPGRLLHEAVSAELRAAGHQIGGDGSAVVVEGAVQRFEVKASKTSLYWAVDVNLTAAVTAMRGGRKLSHSYVARCQDVAYAAPDAGTMAPVVARCVGDLARQFRDDPEMAGVIGG
jgi:uncharacterized lipoprotein YajG